MLRLVVLVAGLVATGQALSCYSCIKTTVGGRDLSFNQPVCDESHMMVCPGTDFCVSGNYVMNTGDGTQVTEYFKGCGRDKMRSCDEWRESLYELNKASGSSERQVWLEECNLDVCTGDRCNTKTVQEVKDFSKSFFDWIFQIGFFN